MDRTDSPGWALRSRPFDCSIERLALHGHAAAMARRWVQSMDLCFEEADIEEHSRQVGRPTN
jgi:hypothetical protein